MNLWTRFIDGAKAVGGLFMPMFAAARDVRRIGPVLRWAIHAVLLLTVLTVLYVVHRWQNLDQYLWLPSPKFRNLWLPLLFLLVYLLCWLGRWLWDLISPEQEFSVYPDIDQAWQEAVRTLDQAGLDLAAAPLFLVLGRPRGSEEALLQGVQPRLLVNHVPRRPDSPLHVYANRDGTYISCPGASLMGRQAAMMAEEAVGLSSDAGAPGQDDGGAEMFATLSPSAQRGAEVIEQIIARAREQGRGPDQLVDEERRAIGLLIASDNQAVANEEVRPRASLLQDRAEVEAGTQRLEYLCRLIARERRPFCPINGILLVFPIAAGRSDDDATQVGLVGQRDLATVRKTLQVRCPVFSLFCDMETMPGFRALTERLPENQRDRRMGQRFPLVPDLEPAGIAGMLESGLQQVGNRLIPNLVSNLWQTETSVGGSLADAVRGNVELYRLLAGVRERQSRFARALTRAVVSEGSPPAMLGGCYLAGTGADPVREQAFIPGVFQRLVESQDFVTWTPEALAAEAKQLFWTRVGYTALGLLTAACALTAGYVLFLSRS